MSDSVHIALKLAADVFNICKPFFQRYKLNGFSYARIYSDGSRTELWSDALALDHTFFKKKYIVGAYTPEYFLEQERFSILQLKVNSYPKKWAEKYTQQLADQRKYFNHDHAFIVVNREIGFHEYFLYYASTEMYSILNFYINNLNILESFSNHFKESAADLIKISDANRISMNVSQFAGSEDLILPPERENQIFLLNKLTDRELEIANFLLAGKVAREVGDILCISKRTVESHIEHIKSKANCRNKSELIGFLHSQCNAQPLSITVNRDLA